MKTMPSLLSVLVLGGAMNSGILSAAATAGVISSDAFAQGSYCHMKFPAIQERTLGTAQPRLKEVDSGDIIDFYGPCSHDPVGKDEVHEQLIHLQHRRARDYMD